MARNPSPYKCKRASNKLTNQRVGPAAWRPNRQSRLDGWMAELCDCHFLLNSLPACKPISWGCSATETGGNAHQAEPYKLLASAWVRIRSRKREREPILRIRVQARSPFLLNCVSILQASGVKNWSMLFCKRAHCSSFSLKYTDRHLKHRQQSYKWCNFYLKIQCIECSHPPCVL